MKTLVSAVTEESRLDIFNEYEPFNFNYNKKDVSHDG